MGPRMVSLPSEMPTVARNSFGDISKRRSLLTWEATRACTVPQMRSEKKKEEKWKKEGKGGKYSQTRTKQALHNSEQQMAIIVLTVTHNGITLRVRGKKKKSLAVEFTTPEEEERQHRRQLPHTATSHQSGTHPFALSPCWQRAPTC